jgi:protoporphyrinogen oxidase
MRIAIVGAGITGLVAGYQLAKSGHQVTIWEKEDQPGGLIAGFKDPDWDWPLEMHYHHLFWSDHQAIQLAKELDIPVFFRRPKTSLWYKNHLYSFDSPQDLLKFPHLSLGDKFNSAKSLAHLKLTPRWHSFETTTAKQWITKNFGAKTWSILWEPLFKGKFAQHYDRISAVWFWASIKKRSSRLGYLSGGFTSLPQKLTSFIQKAGGQIHLQSAVSSVTPQPGTKVAIRAPIGGGIFDRAIIAAESTVLEKILSPLPKEYRERLSWLESLGTTNLILALKNPLLSDGTYWLNINDTSAPFLAVVQHTNFIEKKHYGNYHLVYLGNYLSPYHQNYQLTKDQVINRYLPYLTKINPRFQKDWIHKSWLFKNPFTQPVVTKGYPKIIPGITTPVPHAYWVSLQHIYPWDRGTNYAIEWGKKAADIVLKSQ